jgi:long-chain acyl-CoA synthetase
VNYPKQVDWRLEIAPLTVPELLARSVAAFGARPIIEYRDRQISFSDLRRAVDGVAAGFMARGIGPGSTVALYLPNTPWHSVCLFAAMKAGAKIAHLSPLDAPRELAFKLTDSGADLLISTDLFGLADKAADLVRQGHVRALLIGDDAVWGGEPAAPLPEGPGIGVLEPLLHTPPPALWPQLRPQDVALLQYTGGTTGMPKGAILTHANMTAATAIYMAWADEALPAPGAARIIGVLPMFHIYALIVVLMCSVGRGDLIMLRPRFDPVTTLQDVSMRRATCLPAVPTMLIALQSTPEAASHDLSSLVWVASGGAPLPHEVGQRVEALVGTKLRGGWGMTETCSAGTRLLPNSQASAGLIGVPLPRVELRVVSLTDPCVVLPTGTVGELAVRGPNVFQGYWKQPALSKQVFADGFFLTGDIGRMDERGQFTIVDRKKRMIISGGFNVYPNMIENSIYEHPDVEEVIVIGVPDAYRGEAAKAFVKLRAGAVPLSLDELRLFLADKVGRHELPTALELRDALPKSSVGKLMASALVEEERARSSAKV